MADQDGRSPDQPSPESNTAPRGDRRRRRRRIGLAIVLLLVGVPLFFWAMHRPYTDPVFADPQTPCQEMLNAPPIVLMDEIMSEPGDKRVDGERFMVRFERDLKENNCTIDEVKAFMEPRARFNYERETSRGKVLHYRYRVVIKNPISSILTWILRKPGNMNMSFDQDEIFLSMAPGIGK